MADVRPMPAVTVRTVPPAGGTRNIVPNPRGRDTDGTVVVVANYGGAESPDPDLDLVDGDLVAPAPAGYEPFDGNDAVVYYSRTRDAVAMRAGSSGHASVWYRGMNFLQADEATAVTELLHATTSAPRDMRTRWIPEQTGYTPDVTAPATLRTTETGLYHNHTPLQVLGTAEGETFYFRTMIALGSYSGPYDDAVDTAREALSVEIVRQIPSLGPGHLGVPGGLLASTADVVMPEPGDVTGRRKRSPWDRRGGFPPVDGDAATIDVDGQTRFAGWVEDVDGSAHAPLSVSMVDAVDRMQRTITLDPVANPMPATPPVIGQDHELVYPEPRPEYVLWRALEAAGFRLIPPRNQTWLWLPMMGSLLGYRDNMPPAHTYGRGAPRWMPHPNGGMASAGWDNRWDLSNPLFYGPTNTAPEVNFYVTGPPTATRRLRVEFPRVGVGITRHRVEVQFPEPGRIRFSGNAGSSSWSGVEADRDDTKRIRYVAEGDRVRLYYGGDLLGDWTGGSTEWEADGLRINAQVGTGDSYVHLGELWVGDEIGPEPATFNARIHTGHLLTDAYGAIPHLPTTNVMELVQTIARAQGAAVWLTADGDLHYFHPDVLEAQPPSATISADADLLDMAWSTSVRDVRHRVHVSCDRADVTASRRRNIELWSAPRDALTANSQSTDIATPDGSTTWIDAGGPTSIPNSVTWRHGEGTWLGAVEVWDDGQERWAIGATGTGTASQSMERINSQTFRFLTTVGSLPSHVESVMKKMFQGLIEHWDATTLPVLRGAGKVEWTPATHTGAMTGPVTAADFTHDAGPWVQGSDCQALADWLGARMTQPRPLIEELPIAYRADLELGQVITLVEDQVYDITLTCLVIGLRERHTPGTGAQMWVTLRVLDGEGLDHLYTFGDAPFGQGPFGGSYS